MAAFQVIDDKNNCFGVYADGHFEYDKIPRGHTITWNWSPHLRNSDIEYGYLFTGGKTLAEAGPPHLNERLSVREKKIKAFINSFVLAKVNIETACLYDLIPMAHLKHYLNIKNQICDYVIENTERPQNYSFLKETYETIKEISLQPIRIDWKLLEGLALKDMKASSLLKRFSGQRTFINYAMFGTRTGRLSIHEGSFPILNIKTENKAVLMPKNDWFVELDYNGAEIRTLLSLSGEPQPSEDIHEWNMTRFFDRVKTRDGAKKKFFGWLYNPESVNRQLENSYDKRKVLEKYWQNGIILTPFGRRIEADDFHALNYLLQSSSSDNCMTQVNKIHRFLRNKKSNVAFVVHDSVIIDLAHDERHLIPQIKEIFEDTRLGNFPVGVKIGRNYGQLRELSW